ncbi:cytochrome D ubiquinol oxidase subunit II [bacterium CPR1]|nr:cytochrome D ubiquinol oxidase subunit II [bacterium CPR1]
MPKFNSTGDSELDDLVERIVEHHATSPQADLLRQIVVSAMKLISDGADRGDMKLINTTLKEMRYSFKVFMPYRRRRKVSVFGSARTPEGHPDYLQAMEFSRMMAERGYMCITGAGNGVMKAGHAGAGAQNSFGVNIRLPFEQTANEVIDGDPKLVNFKYFFTRKLAFIKETHAVVCFPGGFGTHDEGFETLTLIQTGKSYMLPVLFVHPPETGFWNDLDSYIRKRLLPAGMISEEDLHLYLVTDSVERACDEITTFYRRYHSMRYVGDELVMRLESPVSEEDLAQIQAEFADLLVEGGAFRQAPALPDEADDQPIVHLPRLIFRYHRRRYGRLRQLIDRINSFGP